MRGARVRSAAAALLFAAGAAGADDVYLSGRVERISTGGVGGGGGVEWYRSPAPRRTLKLGLSAFALPDTRWGSGTAGATFTVGRTIVATDATVGHSNIDGSYVQLRGNGSQPLVERRLMGDLECQYVGGRSAHGGLAKAGLTFLPRPALIFQAGYFFSFRGTLGTRLGMGKVVYIAGSRRYQVGGSVGRSSPSVLGLLDEQATQSLRHVFGGVALPVGGGGELLLTLEHYDLEIASRSQFSLAWKLGHR